MGSYVDSEILEVDLMKECTMDATLMNLFEQGEDDFFKNLSECATLEDRIRCIQMPFNWLPTRAETLEKYQKNTGVSEALRKRGNGKFKTKNLEDALESYNLAIMFGKATDEELGLAYANRSAVLVEMQDYEGALEDVELAINNNYPVALADKLQSRRSKCNDLILKRDQNEVQKKVAAEVEARKLVREEMLKIETNPLIPSAASCVQIKHDDVRGRHLIVDQDVSPGTVLIVENPYAAILRNEVNWETKHCHYCLKKIRRGVPCEGCVFVMYCDEACKLKAHQEFHQWECKCMPQLHCNSTPDYILLALRIICKVGPEELARLFMTRDPRFFKQSDSYGTEENCKYESDAYLSVYHLQTTSKHLGGRNRYGNTHLALLWTEVLDTETNFFKGITGMLAFTPEGTLAPPQTIKGFKNFVAEMMLRHIESVPLNYLAVGELTGLENYSLSSFFNGELSQNEMFKKIENADLAEYADGIYPAFSMMTHSCDGNTIRINDVSEGTVIVIAKRRLKAGETLFTTYGMHYISDSKLDRQSYMQERYYFNCQCAACELDWPLLENLESETRFCCPTCSKKVRDDGGCKELRKYQLVGPTWKCGGCGKRYKERDLIAKFTSNVSKFSKILQCVFHNDPCDAMKRLTEIIEYFQYHLCPPNKHEYYGQIVLTKAVALILTYAQTVY